jgi:hypothetical protein
LCLIAHRDTIGPRIPNEVINYNRSFNPDGFGIAWRDPEAGLKFEKFAPTEFEAFRVKLKDIDKTDMEYAAHWRRATHGPACLKLSHPFVYDDAKVGDTLVFHNGIINIATEKHESDTSAFVERVLASLPVRWWADAAIRFLVESSIGWSRILLMTKDETVRINSKDWEKHQGMWYSVSPLPSKKYQYKKVTPAYLLPATTVRDVTLKDTIPADWQADWNGDDHTFSETKKYDDLFGATEADGLGWLHQGHWVSPVSDYDEEEEDEVMGQAICEKCNTIGEFYIINRKVTIEIVHAQVLDENSEKEKELLLS